MAALSVSFATLGNPFLQFEIPVRQIFRRLLDYTDVDFAQTIFSLFR